MERIGVRNWQRSLSFAERKPEEKLMILESGTVWRATSGKVGVMKKI